MAKPRRPLTLQATLASIDELLARHRPDAARSFRPPATKRARTTLARLFKHEHVPDDLDAWFSWHDGQLDVFSPGAHPVHPAITFLSIKDALANRRSLIDHPDKMLPWEDSWLPIATNGGDDYYVYVTAGKRRGTVLYYLHDARRRPVIASSLRQLAGRLSEALAVLDRSPHSRTQSSRSSTSRHRR